MIFGRIHSRARSSSKEAQKQLSNSKASLSQIKLKEQWKFESNRSGRAFPSEPFLGSGQTKETRTEKIFFCSCKLKGLGGASNLVISSGHYHKSLAPTTECSILVACTQHHLWSKDLWSTSLSCSPTRVRDVQNPSAQYLIHVLLRKQFSTSWPGVSGNADPHH